MSAAAFAAELPSFYGLWSFSKNKSAEGAAALPLAKACGHQARGRLVRLRSARLQDHALPRHLENRRSAGWHRLWLSAACRRADFDHWGAGAQGQRGRPFEHAASPDMFNLTRQVRAATDRAANAAGRLAGKELLKFANDETTIAQLKDRIANTID
jgi:hypothetical protein